MKSEDAVHGRASVGLGQVLQSKFFCNVNVGKLKGRPDEIAKILKYCRSADVLHSSLDLEESLLE